MTIQKPDGFVLTYLYDAKYRVQDDKNDCELDEDADIDIADYPLPDAINQMHRYRDAIYYAMKEDERPRGKEIIGGYILFPGRTEGDAIENRYFYKSIKKVNIGAFPLLPADKEHKDNVVQCDLLEKHLREILMENSVYEHVKDSVPQKGLFYTGEKPKEGIVYVGYVNKDNPFIDDFIACNAEMYYTGGEDTKHDLDIQQIKYLMPIVKGKINGIYKVSAINAARKRDKAINEKTTNDGVRFFLMLDEFIPFGDDVNVKNNLHNAEWMSLDMAKQKYEELKDRL